ncbi:MAG: ribonuclease III [Clostridia bacterium]|nr:ribonuclease III [Clostridia bacterium]
MKRIVSLKERIPLLEEKIGYCFKNKENLVLALTHSSYANEIKNHRMQSNERLEFLGDAVLNIAISEKIYLSKSGLAEGEMTRVRSNIVCEASLMDCSNKLNIGSFLLLGKGEEMTGGRGRTSILSDTFEAIIGAIYLDSGLDNAKAFIYEQMKEIIENSIKGTMFTDYKTQLQEEMQKSSECRILYEIIDEQGPDHNKVFISQVKVNDVVMGTGEGRSKKEAEQSAAKKAIISLKN